MAGRNFTVVKRKRNPKSPPADGPSTSKRNTNESSIEIKNKYAELSDLSDADKEDNNMQTESGDSPIPETPTQQRREPKIKKMKLPPIVLHGSPNPMERFMRKMDKLVKDKTYEIKHGEVRTSIYVQTTEAWDAVTSYLKSKKMSFHTYTHENKKTHSFVLCGLNDDTDPKTLQTELNKIESLQLQKVFRMKKTKFPKFLIITGPNITLKSIAKLNVIFNTRVKWQRYTNSKIITQCHRCQDWGHATSNCFSKPFCLKCSEEHLTSECNLKAEDPPKCANCDGPHPANYIECPEYLRVLAIHHQNAKKLPSASTKPNPPPNIHSMDEFRPLRAPKQSLQNVWGKNSTETNNRQHEADQPVFESEFVQIKAELKTLNELIDMKTFLQQLQELNARLRACETPSQRFITMNDFYAKLDAPCGN